MAGTLTVVILFALERIPRAALCAEILKTAAQLPLEKVQLYYPRQTAFLYAVWRG